MAFIINPKNKKEEKVVRAFLNSLEIEFHSEVEEDAALYKAMKEGRKSKLLNKAEKNNFLKQLKKTR